MNLLDLNNDILNIIGVYVKKDNLERKIIKDRQMMSDKQIINGKEIRFCPYHNFYWFDLKNYDIKVRGTISKEYLTLKKLNLKAVKNLSVFLEKIYL